jgi:hypothetical protein
MRTHLFWTDRVQLRSCNQIKDGEEKVEILPQRRKMRERFELVDTDPRCLSSILRDNVRSTWIIVVILGHVIDPRIVSSLVITQRIDCSVTCQSSRVRCIGFGKMTSGFGSMIGIQRLIHQSKITPKDKDNISSR